MKPTKVVARRYYLRHRGKISEKARLKRQENPELAREIAREYNRRHPETQIKRNRQVRQRVLKILGDKCIRCGFDDERALQVDHIDGGGTQERKTRGTMAIYYLVLKDSTPYQLLCANCNWIKRWENDEVPRSEYGL